MSEAKAPAAPTEKFVAPPSWRERCEILRLNAETKADFFPLHTDFIKCLGLAKSIDFILYISVGWEMYEFIRPKDFTLDLVKEMLTAHKQYPSQTRICVKKADFGRYEKLVAAYMHEKFTAASSGNSMALTPAFKFYATLSESSQLISRGTLDEECYNRISRSSSYVVMHMLSTKDILNFLVSIVGKEPGLYDHGAVTAMVSTAIAWNSLKLPKRESKLTGQAAILHDVERHCGYLNKPADRTQVSALAVKELTAIKAKGVGFHDSSLEVMQQYREHFDGSGIPKKLKGAAEGHDSLNGISRMARIVAIGCAFSEYMLKRQDKLPLTLPTILKLLGERAAKGEFDPSIVQAFTTDANTGTVRKPSDDQSVDDDDDYEDE